jgi:hypothetical protein
LLDVSSVIADLYVHLYRETAQVARTFRLVYTDSSDCTD